LFRLVAWNPNKSGCIEGPTSSPGRLYPCPATRWPTSPGVGQKRLPSKNHAPCCELRPALALIVLLGSASSTKIKPSSMRRDSRWREASSGSLLTRQAVE